MKNYTGTIIEESLEQKEVLHEMKIVKTVIEPVTAKHKTPWIKQWTLHTVEIKENQAQKIANQLSLALDFQHNWYADFKNDIYHFIIFRNKIFKVNRSKNEEYKNIKQYGISLGIPDYQLDFSPNKVMRAELHCHSNQDQLKLFYAPWIKDSIMSVEQIINHCIDKIINILAITDHDSLNGYKKAKELIDKLHLNIILIPACEITTANGHILALNIKQNVPPHLSAKQTINQIHRQNGIAIAAHPASLFASLRKKVFDLDLDGIEGFNACMPKYVNKKSIELGRKKQLPIIAGSDAHDIPSIGKATMIFPKNTKSVSDVIKHIIDNNFEIDFKQTTFTSYLLHQFIIRAKFSYSKIFNL